MLSLADGLAVAGEADIILLDWDLQTYRAQIARRGCASAV
jgi:hypothetical protein